MNKICVIQRTYWNVLLVFQKILEVFDTLMKFRFSVGKWGKKSANCVGKGVIAESGVDWCPKKLTKNPTISAGCFYFNVGLTPPTVFCKYLAEYAFLW